MTLDMLKAFGADVTEGMNRCMDNEEFYLRLIKAAMEDGAFEALGGALSASDTEKAFEEAHKLKGVLGNLSLTPIYEPLAELTELLRHKTPGDYEGLYGAAMEKKNELKALLEQ